MVVEKEEFEDWDGGDFEALFPEAEDTDRDSTFVPEKKKVVAWKELCDHLLCTYKDHGLLGVEKELTKVRATHGGGHREEHQFVDTVYALTGAEDVQTRRRAWGILYSLLWSLASASALRYLPDGNRDEVMDVVHDTFIHLQGREPKKGDRIIGLIVTAAANRAKNLTNSLREREVELVSIEDIRNDQGEPMSLDELEQPGMEHPWLTATTTETPESVYMAGDLSRLIAKFGNEVGPDRYAVFCAVEVDGLPITTICREFDVDQSTAYRWVAEVRSHVRDRLIEAGYEL